MEILKKKFSAFGLALAFAVCSYWIAGGFFAGPEKSQLRELERIKIQKLELNTFLSRKDTFQNLWSEKKDFFKSLKQEELLNDWIKELLAYAESNHMTFRKLEPAGVKETKGTKEQRLAVSFQGDIRTCIHFLYYLTEHDPLAAIRGFALQQDEETKQWLIEIQMGKILYE